MSELVSGLMALRLSRVLGGNQGYTGTLQEDLGKYSQIINCGRSILIRVQTCLDTSSGLHHCRGFGILRPMGRWDFVDHHTVNSFKLIDYIHVVFLPTGVGSYLGASFDA